MARLKNGEQLHIGCTSEELKMFRKAAEAEHLPLATFIKVLLHKHIEASRKQAAA